MITAVSTVGDSHGVRSLIDFALESLPAMQLDDGAFCFERRVGQPAPLGRSVRYTLMVELGLVRAQAAGYQVPFDLDELDAVAWRELEAGELTPGDIGLMLWADARREGKRGHLLANRLDAALAATGGLGARLGMELGWIVTGLAYHVAADGSSTGARLLADALDQLLLRNRAASALVRHFGDAGWRRRFPNFATQIYSVLALAVVARHGLDDRALPAAIGTAERLLETQLPDGGWPWLFDVDRGTVVERYELYSVHQDAMAPMALLELSELCGDPRYIAAVAEGLAVDPGPQRIERRHDRSCERSRPALDPPHPGTAPPLGWSEDGRIARRPADPRSDRTPDRDRTRPTGRTTSAGSSRPGADVRGSRP